MTRDAYRNMLIASDQEVLGRPLTDEERQNIERDLDRATHGSPWLDWAGYRVQRMVRGSLFPSLKAGLEYWALEEQVNAPRKEHLAWRDKLHDRMFDAAKR